MTTQTPYKDEWITVPHNIKLYARLQAPTEVKGAVVFAHGFVEHLARYDFVRERLVEKGFAVLFYDQRGFGQSALDAKNRSTGSSYGKNTREELLDDLGFMLKYARDTFKTDNLFLYGHSMGGCVTLQFACVGNDTYSVKQYLRGVVATSPLILLRHQPPQWQLIAGHWLSKLIPWFTIPAPVNAKDLTHDEAVQLAYIEDPLIKEQGTLRGVDSMLRKGASVVERDYQSWPESLPIFLLHGTDDQITCPKATQRFHDQIKAVDKSIALIKGGFHELHNEPEFKIKLLDDITSWLDAHVVKGNPTPTPALEHADTGPHNANEVPAAIAEMQPQPEPEIRATTGVPDSKL